jgi:hypothetical protein
VNSVFSDFPSTVTRDEALKRSICSHDIPNYTRSLCPVAASPSSWPVEQNTSLPKTIFNKSKCWAEPHSRFPLSFLIFLPKFEFVFHWRLSSSLTIYDFGWSRKLSFEIWGRSDQRLLRYLTFYLLRLSFIGDRLPLEVVFISHNFLFWVCPWAKFWNKWRYNRYLTFNTLRSSSIGGHPHFNQFLIVFLSPNHKFKILGKFSI